MKHIKNTWYPAAWAHELAPKGPMPPKPLARRICGEDIVFYRSQKTGQVVALHDMCPHRFAPLSFGDIVGDNIKCRYHGLQFDSAGDCAADPGGDKPPKICVKKFHVEEHEQLIYLWVGDGEPDGPAPDLLGSMRDGYAGALRGHLDAKVNYSLLIDNLNDDAHATNLHQLLNSSGHSNRDVGHRVVEDEVEPNSVTTYVEIAETTCIPLFFKFVKDPRQLVAQQIRIHWKMPGNMNISTGVYDVGGDPETQVGVDSWHMITPADENNCHYFWVFKRNRLLEDHDFTQQMSGMLAHIFKTEDIWMAEGQAARMAGREFWEMKPKLLAQDKAAVLVRRRIEKLVEKTHAGAKLTDEG